MSVAEARDEVGTAELGVVLAKLQPPRPPASPSARTDLLDGLDARRHAVVLLQAPAGYGKTTVVRQWVEHDPRPYAWLTLDRGDDDPIVLLRHLVLALDGVVPMARAWHAATLGGTWDARSALPAMAADLSEPGVAPFVLVLDDLHEVAGVTSRELVERLLDLVPEGSTVAITTRTQTPHAARRRLAGTLIQLDVGDLRLDEASATRLLHDMCPELADGLAQTVVERCDGWTAGIVLAALALRGSSDPERIVARLAAAARPMADYLQDEVLGALGASERRFLVETSVLDLLHADLCDAVLGRTDSHEILRRLVAAGDLLLAPLDDGGAWYRAHGLLRDLLLAELRASAPRSEPELRRRAGGWLREHGFADEAVRQLLAAGDRPGAAHLVASEIGHLVHEGRVATLERWISAFSIEEIRSDPGLTIVAAWGAMLSGQRSDLAHWLRALDGVDASAVLPDGTTVGTARAAIEMLAGTGGTKRTAEAADRIVALGPSGNPWWVSARQIGAVARYASGELDDPLAEFTAVATDARSEPLVRAVAAAQLALLAARAHDVARSATLTREALDLMRAAGVEDYPVAVMVHAAAALDAALRGDGATAATAADRVDRLIALVPSASTRALIQLRLVLAETALHCGDDRRAAAELHTAVTELASEPDAALFAEWADALAARLAVRVDGVAAVALTGAEQRVLELLPTHHTLGEIAELLYVSRNTVKTQTIAVYRKLGVAGRSDAVERARELGILAR